MHYVGTILSMVVLVWAIATQSWWWLIAVPLAGYGAAWIAHFFIEKNRPATFTYPLWSLISDFRMFFLWFAGGLDKHLKAAGVA